MKIVKDIFITIWLLFFTILLGFVCWDAIMRLTEDKNADSNLRGQISQLNVKIDSLENMIMHGQKPKNTSVKVDANLCELKSQLRLENDDLKSQLKNQLDFIEKKIEHEEKIVDDLKGNITFWFCFVTIVVTIIAIGVPLYNMGEIKDKQKEIEDKQKEVEETQKEVEDKQKEIEEKQKKLEEKQKKVEETQKEVEEKQKDFEEKQKKLEGKLKSSEASYDKVNKQIDSVKTNLSQLEEESSKFRNQISIDSTGLTLYMLADAKKNNINDPLFYYDLIIDNLKEFGGIHYVYYNRGQLRFEKGDYKKAIEDFDMAIKKKKDEPDYYSSCAKCYRELVKIEKDPTERTKNEDKAKEYENTAEELKQKGK